MKAIRRTHLAHHHFADVLTADAYYLTKEFINEVSGMGIHPLIRVKGKQMSFDVITDASGLFNSRGPDEVWRNIRLRDEDGDKVRYGLEISDQDGISWSGVKPSLWVIRFRETRHEYDRYGKEKVRKRETWVVTTLTKDEATAVTIWKMAKARWCMENNGIHDPKTYWHLDHCYAHALTRSRHSAKIN